MKDNDIIYIRLYSNNEFKGKFILKYGDAKQIEYWWKHQQKRNYVQYETIINF